MSPYGSELTSSGWPASFPLLARTVPVTGAIRSLTLLTDSMSPQAASASTASPALGRHYLDHVAE